MLNHKEQGERLKMLYSMFAGIPKDRITLQVWRAQYTRDYQTSTPSDDAMLHECGTVGCMAGWSTVYPPFKELGLGTSEGGASCPAFGAFTHYMALGAFFGLPTDVAYNLFKPNDNELLGDKAEGLRRIRNLLVRDKHITPERSNELAFEELRA